MRTLLRPTCFFALLLAACVAPTNEVGPTGESAISNGANVESGKPGNSNTVVLRATLEGKARTAFCSGVLVHSRLVLTAAHCLENPLADLEVEFPKAKATSATEYVPVAASKIHEKYSPSGSSYDVGLVLLSRDRPEAYEPVRDLQLDPAALQKGKRFAIVGAGRKGQFETTAGERQYADVKMRRYLHTTYFRHAIEFPANEEAKGACPGDSGGPAFLYDGDTLRLAGVAASATCGNGMSLYTFLGGHAKWIERTGRALLGKNDFLGFARSTEGKEIGEDIPEFTTIPNRASNSPQFQCKAEANGEISAFALSFTSGSQEDELWADLAITRNGKTESHLATFSNVGAPHAVNQGRIESAGWGLLFVLDDADKSGLNYVTTILRPGGVNETFSCTKSRPLRGTMTAASGVPSIGGTTISKEDVLFPDKDAPDVCFVKDGQSVEFADLLSPVGKNPFVRLSKPVPGCRYTFDEGHVFAPRFLFEFD